jgi:hypothetical protein
MNWILGIILSAGTLGLFLLGHKRQVRDYDSPPRSHLNNGRLRKTLGAPVVRRDDSSLGLYCELEPKKARK